jgi:hypothetical protein
MSTMVTVYHFQVWDQGKGRAFIPRRKSTPQRIKQIGGELIPDTAQEIDPSRLDKFGRYDPQRVLS